MIESLFDFNLGKQKTGNKTKATWNIAGLHFLTLFSPHKVKSALNSNIVLSSQICKQL